MIAVAVKEIKTLRGRRKCLFAVKTAQILRGKSTRFIYGKEYLCNRRITSESNTAKVLGDTLLPLKEDTAFFLLKQTGLCTFALTAVKETTTLMQLWVSFLEEGDISDLAYSSNHGVDKGNQMSLCH